MTFFLGMRIQFTKVIGNIVAFAAKMFLGGRSCNLQCILGCFLVLHVAAGSLAQSHFEGIDGSFYPIDPGFPTITLFVSNM